MEIQNVIHMAEAKFKTEQDPGEFDIHSVTQHELSNWWVVRGQIHRTRLSFNRYYTVFVDGDDYYVYEVLAVRDNTDAEMVARGKALHVAQYPEVAA